MFIQRIKTSLILISTAVVMVGFFQNCSKLAVNSGNPANVLKMGGDGVEGMRYLTYAYCANTQQIGVESAIVMQSGYAGATKIRANCSDLNQPQDVDVNTLSFLNSGKSLFQLGNQVYDEQALKGIQRVTLEVCESNDIQLQVWEAFGAPSIFYGSVTAGGNSSGILNLQAPQGSTPSSYASTSGQSSQFTLDVTGNKLTYKIGSNSQITTNVTCASQAIPPSPPTSSGLALDANGWTVLNPTASARVIYVSNSAGNDVNDGLSQSTPVRTLVKGVSLMRDGSPDWLLLKQGDTWTGENMDLCAPGLSASQPAVISTYGSGARPLVKVASNLGIGVGSNGSGGCGGTPTFLAIIGVEFYAYDRDPASPNFNGATVDTLLTGAYFVSQGSWILIENSKFSFFETDIAVENGGADFVGLRRNVITDTFSVSYYGPGVYMDNVKGILLEENFLDHNGWVNGIPGAGKSIGRQSIYITGNNGPALLTGNISTNAGAAGAQLGAGGVMTNNLLVADAIGALLYSDTVKGLFPATISNNVILEGDDISSSLPRGWGINIFPNGAAPTIITGNIIKQSMSSQPATAYGVLINSGASGVSVLDNVICQWSQPISDNGANNMTGPNMSNDSTCVGLGFPSPDASIESYDSSIGGAGTLADFVARGRAQSHATWNNSITAASANAYIRAGFGM